MPRALDAAHNLPPDVLDRILGFLNFRYLLSVTGVCTTWRDSAARCGTTIDLNTSLPTERIEVSHSALASIVWKFPLAQSFTLRNNTKRHFHDSSLVLLAQGCPSLQSIHVVCSAVSGSSLGVSSLLPNSMLGLRILEIEGFDLTSDGVATIFRATPNLKMVRFGTRMGGEWGTIDDDVVQEVANYLPNLEALTLSGANGTAYGTASVALTVLGRTCHNLRSLVVGIGGFRNYDLYSDGVGVDDGAGNAYDSSAVIELCTGCPMLEELVLFQVDAITDACMEAIGSLRHLKSLQLRTAVITDAGLGFIADGCTQLQYLSLDKCHSVSVYGIRDITDACPDLVSVVLYDCSQFFFHSQREEIRFLNIHRALEIGHGDSRVSSTFWSDNFEKKNRRVWCGEL